MTVETTTSRVSHNGAGTTGPFSIPFYFLQDADIRAIKVTIADGTEDELSLTTDFTLTGAGDPDGGELTLTSSLSSSFKIVIFRDPEILQEADYSANDSFPSETHEQVADRLTMIAQRFSDLLGRSIVQPDGDGDLDMRLPAAATRASKYLAFNADGEPVASSGTSESAVISTFSETVLDDTSAAAWLTTLGFSTYAKTLIDDADAATARTTLGTYSSAEVDAAIATAVAAAVASLVRTGDAKLTIQDTADDGWVLFNDTTLGDASSGATGRANADTEDLFILMWTKYDDAQCAVSGGRGASAAADYAAHKTIAMPKALGRALAVAGAGSGLTSRAMGLATGAEEITLTGAQSGTSVHAHTASGSGTSTTTVFDGTGGAAADNVLDGATANDNGVAGNSTTFSGTLSMSINVNNSSAANAAEAHPNMQPTSFAFNVMVKL